MDARTELQAYFRAQRQGVRTQAWLAEQIGVDPSLMSRWVNGLHPPDSVKDQIAKALGKSVNELWPSDATEAKAA